MKSLYKLSLWVIGVFMVTSCTDYEPLEFTVEKPEDLVSQEEIDAYGSLKSYVDSTSDFTLGGAASIAEYNNKDVMYRLLNSNFHEITPGYGLKHGAVVQNDGTLNLAVVSEFLNNAEQAGIAVYGHSLAWHANQNANYLNSLLAPIVIESPAYPNDLDKMGLEDGSFSGYDLNGNDDNIWKEENEGLDQQSPALVMEATSGVSNPDDLRLTTPEIPVVEGHEYEVVFLIKSDVSGEGRVSFEGLNQNEPLLDYEGEGALTETFETEASWKEVRIRVSDFSEARFKVNFDLGYQPGVNYYLDIKNLYVYDTQGEAMVTNLIEDGDFETGSGWGGWGNDSERGITDGGESHDDSRAFYLTNPSITEGFWEVQTAYGLPETLVNEETYTLSFWVKGNAEGIIRPELQSPDYSSDAFGQIEVTEEWRLVEVSTTATADDRGSLVFSYGEFAGTVYIDNVSLRNANSSGGESISIARTPEEKYAIVAMELERWISGLLSKAAYIDAWDVVNEPMDDANPYELKSAETDSDIAEDEFYWQDYLGKDYAVKAFQLAEAYGDADDLHFINDYNLEYNLDKCKGLIEFVEYIEEQGARVDGIGTQMHISIDSNRDNIAEMFRLLAETGKLIKVSELDVRTNVSEPTDEILEEQAQMYRYVLDTYNEYVPKEQQYGITVWGITDSTEDADWLPGEFQGLWDVNFNRKPAYAIFAEALEHL